MTPEAIGEMLAAGKTKFHGDFRHAAISALQEFIGFFDAIGEEKLPGRPAEVAAKKFNQMRNGHSR